ncbi:hypothetical protein CH267_12665 [Rhodococcus sp. 06-621-2]|nr:DUF2637 domain-containing protein [Rhodococcus sp. 06-621-2]OZC55436.1 hypothetical protein CH267_12665 [Rhodococcus sp. 06-621-2]
MSNHHRPQSDALPIHPRVLQWALVTAVVLTVGIAGASFWLSFAVLRDLAAMAGLGASEAWVIPVVLDGAIVSTTVTAIALSNHVDERTIRGRRFVVAVLVVAAATSIAGNAYHAVLTAKLLSAIVSAGIATIAPIALLAMTEVLAVILRAPRSTSAPVEVDATPPVPLVRDDIDRDSQVPAVRSTADVRDPEELSLPIELDADDGTLPPEVEETVRLRHAHKEWSWARIGQETDGAVASTAMRRYRKWEESASQKQSVSADSSVAVE